MARNLWGLLLLPVAVAAALVGPFVDTAYRGFFESSPRVSIDGTGGAWASFAGGRVRLRQLSPASVSLAGAQVWQARVGYDAPADSPKYGGCKVYLEDAQGRTFESNPVELIAAHLDGAIGCAQPTELSGSPPPSTGLVQYEVNYYFVLPPSARAVALRITVPTETPRYARLTPPS